MDAKERLRIIKEVGEEIVAEQELLELLERKKSPVAYDGFEPSGSLHIAQGILRAINVNKMTKAGCRFKMLVADWHAWANNKLGGDLEKIQTTGRYMIEVWRATGMTTDKVEFVWASELVADSNYWKKVIQIARNASVNRIIRCSQIMGRKETDNLSAAQIFYPCMQAADIFHLQVDIAQLGMDQRKVNMLAREIGPQLGFWKPISVSHHMLMGLGQPVSKEKDAVERAIELKMSKSKPETAIFMSDSYEDIKRKIMNAYCPEKTAAENPIMEYCKYIIFGKFKEMKIERDKKYGRDITLSSYEELAKLYSSGALHPLDLKKAVAEHINKLIEPIRKHFEKGKAKELYEEVKSFNVTR